MNEVFNDNELEPILQHLHGKTCANNSSTTDEDARLDIKAHGLWKSSSTKTFFDVKLFNPLVNSCPKNLEDAFKYHETIKKQKCKKQIIDAENTTFAPFLLLRRGGAMP